MKRFSGIVWPVLLLALLAILAWLQYRWTGQIRDAEQERMRAGLESSVRRFARDLDEELVTALQTFRVERASELETALAQYRDESRYPELVGAVYSVDGAGALARLDAGSTELVPVAWPPSLAQLRERLVVRPERGRRGGPSMRLPAISARPLVIAVPMAPRERRRPGALTSGHALIVFDERTLTETVLPELVAQHFGSELDVVVVDGSGNVVFATTETGDDILTHPDARGALFSPYGGRPFRRRDRRPPPPELVEPRERADELAWHVLVRHRAGSLEAYVASSRTRNLIVSIGILGILAASVGLVAVSTRRATELNDRKMEFIAGVSHELRTPVAVLRSAGQNLADGSVSGAAQVRRYGALIESEGRRLNDLVEQVLELAGIQSQRRQLRREPVSSDALVADAMADCASVCEDGGVEITTSAPGGSTTLLGDPDAMRRAVGNIIMNAIKHGGEGKTVEIVTERRGPKVAIEVTDHGPGISDEELEHLFEPFYRGSRAHQQQVPGSGLGLSLVEHIVREHGGSVEVESAPGTGSRFTVYFPAVE